MSTSAMLPNISPAPTAADTSVNTTKSTSRVRMTISALQNLVAQDKSVLSLNDIHILHKRGLLPTDATTSASSNTRQDTPSHTPVTGTSQRAISSFTPAPSTTPRAAAFSPSPSSKGLQRAHAKSHPYHHNLKKGRPLPVYHDEVIEDTCSHLYTDLHAYNAYTNILPQPGFRRYSESSRPYLARSGAPVANDTISHSRRASIATTPVPVIRTPEGTRTVLYQDAHGHTLLSLPTKAVGTSVATPAMDAFQFPAMDAFPPLEATTATSPRLPSLSPSLSASPSPRMRSKRKSSVPIRSPSSKESQDTSPGVIFQLPFGVPPLAVPRKTSTSSCSTSSSSSTRSGSDTPPAFCSYPTPATTGKIAFAAEGESRQGESTQSRFPTPTSPMDRSGLGIHVQKMFTEADAKHPLESSSAINEGTEVQQQRKPITFTEQDSGASIGDIVIAEQSFAAAAAAAHRQGDLTRQGSEIMPTPPSTSTIMSTGVMSGAPSGSHTDKLIASPRILLTPCNSAPTAGLDTQPVCFENEEEKQEDQDPSSLPLREQRLLSIRRRSLIPRQDLDFVRGSGILPPASTDLVTRGGAKILSYSVLLSDVVNVQKESMKIQERDTEEEEPAPVTVKGKMKPKPKRKRAGTGRRIQAGVKGQRSQGHDPSADGNDEYDDDEEVEGSLSADEYDDRDHHEDDEHFHRGGHYQHGYMSVASHKRPRVDHTTAASLKPTRTVLERHGASTYKRSNRRFSKSSPSPSMSPRMSTLHSTSPGGSSTAMAEYSQDQELDIENGGIDMEDVEVHVDDNDYDDTLGNGDSSEHVGSRQIPEELRIPAAEVEVVMKLTREMLQAEERLNLHQTQKAARNNRRPSIKTPKATAAATAASAVERKSSTGDAAPTKKSKSTTAKSSTKTTTPIHPDPTPKTAISAGGSKPKEGKPAKECEACKQKETPCWRPGYTPGGSLCNSCGLRYKKSGVFCPKEGCKYIPLKTEYASMEEERVAMNKEHLKCRKCHGRVELPTR
ncbi:DNA-binding transcription repressor [Mortierella alpina]|nr:DNA-binding transcription repressor [Mortierella alpina]